MSLKSLVVAGMVGLVSVLAFGAMAFAGGGGVAKEYVAFKCADAEQTQISWIEYGAYGLDSRKYQSVASRWNVVNGITTVSFSQEIYDGNDLVKTIPIGTFSGDVEGAAGTLGYLTLPSGKKVACTRTDVQLP